MIGIAAQAFLDRINLIIIGIEKEREEQINNMATLVLTTGYRDAAVPFKDSYFPSREKDWEHHTPRRGRKKRR
jgi:hypothetical protein